MKYIIFFVAGALFPLLYIAYPWISNYSWRDLIYTPLFLTLMTFIIFAFLVPALSYAGITLCSKSHVRLKNKTLRLFLALLHAGLLFVFFKLLLLIVSRA